MNSEISVQTKVTNAFRRRVLTGLVEIVEHHLHQLGVTNAFRRRVLTGRVYLVGWLGGVVGSPMPFGVESSPDVLSSAVTTRAPHWVTNAFRRRVLTGLPVAL